MNTLITICARGGSKGLANKHLLNFNGKPLILWTVKQAVDWGKGDIVLSSDSSDIISLFLNHVFNQNVINRPNGLSGDDVPKLDVIRHALIDTEKRTGKQYDIVVDLDATNPLRRMQDIQECYELVAKWCHPVAFSVVKARKNPYFNMVEEDGECLDVCKYKKGYEDYEYPVPKTRQNCPVVYEMNASIYIYSRKWLLNEYSETPIDDKTGLWFMPAWTFCDIDSEVDFKVAEFLMREYML